MVDGSDVELALVLGVGRRRAVPVFGEASKVARAAIPARRNSAESELVS
jgi:hypothetical protein